MDKVMELNRVITELYQKLGEDEEMSVILQDAIYNNVDEENLQKIIDYLKNQINIRKKH